MFKTIVLILNQFLKIHVSELLIIQIFLCTARRNFKHTLFELENIAKWHRPRFVLNKVTNYKNKAAVKRKSNMGSGMAKTEK